MNMKKIIAICLLAFLSLITFSCKDSVDKKYQGMPKELVSLCKLIDDNPNDPDAYFKRASYYYNKGFIEEALSDALQSVKLNSKNAGYYILLSDIYFAKKETDLTEEMLQKAIAIDSKNNEARLKLAELYFHLKMLDECNKTLDEAIALKPHNPKAHLIRAFALKDVKDTTGYLRMLQLVIDQDPKEKKAYLELGYYYQQKLNPIAVNYYQNALQVDPNDIEINYNLAKLYQDLGDKDNAILQYKILLQIDPDNANALNNLGYVYLVFEDKYDQAISCFTKAIEVDSTFVNAICNRGIAFTFLKQYDDARQDFLYCRKINPDFMPAIDELNKLDKIKK